MAAINEPATLEWLRSLLEPGFILAKAMSYYIDANLDAVFHQGQVLSPILRAGELRDKAFGKFWVAFSSNREEPQSTPTSESIIPARKAGVEVQNSSDLIPPILAQASGLVLDVGPGTGTQMPLLRSPGIRRIYGAEPCLGLHAALRARAAVEGLSEKYCVLHCSVVGAELGPALRREGVLDYDYGSGSAGAEAGVFDTIVCVRVLCSVPELERTTKELYALLRPGGKLLVVEHVVNPWWTAKGSFVARMFQGVYHALGWRWVMGDCCLNRDTGRALRLAAESDGGWESVELESWFSRTPIPYISGVLVKKSA